MPLPEPPVLRVLCVDDNRDVADSLGILLELAGFESLVCYDGHTALALAEAYRPDACILDLSMPGMDGDELARQLHRQAGDRLISMVAVTALCDEEARTRTRKAGFDLHLTKPVDPDYLANVLADIVILRGDASGSGEERPGDGHDFAPPERGSPPAGGPRAQLFTSPFSTGRFGQ